MPAERRRKPISPFHRALGEAISEIRGEADLPLERFAENLEMRFQQISDMEGGVTDVKLSTLLEFSDATGIKLSELIAKAEELHDED